MLAMLSPSVLPGTFAQRNTGRIASPMVSSYEIIWAEARMPPIKGYLLFAAHPARTVPYTPSEEKARITSMPMSTLAMMSWRIVPSASVICPKGSTTSGTRGGISATTGARL
ncbi:MAG: hypothetical protein BWY82_00227 [Verrucomicrobia bacterium ADurb.Bin474]|nr:MAG: hypothetical protein BWY82_00227 [Verrucomicrobia bacterium ADurb.Bin474]